MNLLQSPNRLTLKKAASPAVAAALLIVTAFSPLVVSDYIVLLFATILMYVIMSVSWTIFSGPTGYISLATAAFFGVGAYTSAILGDILPLPAMMLIGGAVSFVLALIIGAITLRLRGVYFTIFTFGFVMLLQNIVLWAENFYSHKRGRPVPAVDNVQVFYCMFGALVFVLLLAFFHQAVQIRQGACGHWRMRGRRVPYRHQHHACQGPGLRDQRVCRRCRRRRQGHDHALCGPAPSRLTSSCPSCRS